MGKVKILPETSIWKLIAGQPAIQGLSEGRILWNGCTDQQSALLCTQLQDQGLYFVCLFIFRVRTTVIYFFFPVSVLPSTGWNQNCPPACQTRRCYKMMHPVFFKPRQSLPLMAVGNGWSVQPWAPEALHVCCSTTPAFPNCRQRGLYEELYSHLRGSAALIQWGEHHTAGWGEIWQGCVLCGLTQRLQMKQVLSGQIWKMRAVESGAKWWGSWMLSSRAALLFRSHQGLLGRMPQSLGRANAVLVQLKHELLREWWLLAEHEPSARSEQKTSPELEWASFADRPNPNVTLRSVEAVCWFWPEGLGAPAKERRQRSNDVSLESLTW